METLTKTDVVVEWYKTNKVLTLDEYIRANFISVWGLVEHSFSLHIIGYERIVEGG